MQRLEVSGAVRPICESLGVKRLRIGNSSVFLSPLESLRETQTPDLGQIKYNKPAVLRQMKKGTLYRRLPYRGAEKSLDRPGRKQANVSVRMVRISSGALSCRGKKTWWQLVSRCCWNSARPWHASVLVSFLVGLMTYKHPGTWNLLSAVKWIGFIHSFISIQP